MPRRRLREPERLRSDRVYRCIDHVQHRLRRAEACRDRKITEFLRPPLVAEQIPIRAESRGTALEHLAREAEALRIGTLEAVDRLLEIADHEQRADALL